jgi:hypothetical protein
LDDELKMLKGEEVDYIATRKEDEQEEMMKRES